MNPLLPRHTYRLCHLLPYSLIIRQHFNNGNKQLLIVTSTLLEAKELYTALSAFFSKEQLLLFPVDEAISVSSLASSPEFLYQRLQVLDFLIDKKEGIVIAHTQSMIRHLPTPVVYNAQRINLVTGAKQNQKQLLFKLRQAGYRLVETVEAPLQVARRGDIIDVFPQNTYAPLRIEIAFDQIESLRYFDIQSQRTIEKIATVNLSPATDILLSSTQINEGQRLYLKIDNPELQEIVRKDLQDLMDGEITSRCYQYYALLNPETCSILSYLQGQLILINNDGIKSHYQFFIEELGEYCTQMLAENRIMPNLSYHLQLGDLDTSAAIYFDANRGQDILPARAIAPFNALDLSAATLLKEYLKQYKIKVALANKRQIDMFLSFCKHHDILDNKITFIHDDYSEGIILIDSNEMILTKKELFNIYYLSSRPSFERGVKINSHDDLNEGDYVVHESYGVGRFNGMQTKEVDGITGDYLIIEYAGSDVLLVPAESFHLIRKYKGREAAAPRLTSLSTNQWEKTRKRIITRLDEIAGELIALYADRAEKAGFAFASDDLYQQQFEQQFPYQLTAGQEQSLKEIKDDMERPHAMDRLLCGDVGFGKTEVAFRAAFKAIANGKQVLLLCPTTLLARQHYLLAKERFAEFTTSITLLSRLVPSSELNSRISLINKGKIKFIIATHQGLSDEISYPDLGLIIVDEEQRFGVKQKEKLKLLKDNVDVLSLSATPIPRTLQFSLVGIRGLSQIETPPESRLPIQTYIHEKSDYLIKEIIARELGRGGQVYYLMNNINMMASVAARLKAQFNVVIAIAHAKLSRDRLETIMADFYDGKIDILITTTIIEAGLDIANANTMIIEHADHFGLSQLYQLRGRVGRGNKVSYCYLLVPPRKQLSEIANKRLEAIKEFTELGSGYHIALRDLAIRGAGDLLGQEQSGFIDSIGIELYLRLLKDALQKAKGKETTSFEETVNIKASGYISDNYAGTKSQKIALYKKIINADSIEVLEEVNQEIQDAHGKHQDMMFKQLLLRRQLEILVKTLQLKVSDERSNLRLAFSLEKSLDYAFYNTLLATVREYPAISLQRRESITRLIVDKSASDWLMQIASLLNKITA